MNEMKGVVHNISCQTCARYYPTIEQAEACFARHEAIKEDLLNGYWIGQSVCYTRSLGSDHECSSPYTCDEDGIIVQFRHDVRFEAQALIESEDGARRWVRLLSMYDMQKNDIRLNVRPTSRVKKRGHE